MKEVDEVVLNEKTGKKEHIVAKSIGDGKWFIQANPFSGHSEEILKEHFDALKFVERADYRSDDKSCCGFIYRELDWVKRPAKRILPE